MGSEGSEAHLFVVPGTLADVLAGLEKFENLGDSVLRVRRFGERQSR
jgi:hypothetical protein